MFRLRRSFATAAAAATSHSTVKRTNPLLQTPATEITSLPNGLRIGSETSGGEVATIAVSIDGKRLL
jgi:hypothetical protein